MILFKYIMKAHLIPFIFSIFTLISVFLLQFLMKFADKLVGKGLSFWIIVKLITYNLAWMVVLVVPMAVLVATLMAFGGMAQNNEVAIMKATGISLYKMMIPPLAGSILVAFLLIQFNNNIYPNANHAAKILSQDIKKKKPTLALVPGVFSQEVSQYSILVRDIDEEKNILKELTIYDNSNPENMNVITAKTGKLYFSPNQTRLVMDLWDGEIHSSKMHDSKAYRKIDFKKHKIVMDAEEFALQETAPGEGDRGDRELSAQQLEVLADSVNTEKLGLISELESRINRTFTLDSAKSHSSHLSISMKKRYVYLRATERLESAQALIKSASRKIYYKKERYSKYWVEIHKKYSLPIACIVFILLGAPLGTMTRKGGIGMAASISVFFFVIYWAFLIGGEKLADRGMLSPFWGMWSANFVLGALGLYLTFKSGKERVTLSFDFLMKLLPKQFRNTNGQ